jgi:hypothetical protein
MFALVVVPKQQHCCALLCVIENYSATMVVVFPSFASYKSSTAVRHGPDFGRLKSFGLSAGREKQTFRSSTDSNNNKKYGMETYASKGDILSH